LAIVSGRPSGDLFSSFLNVMLEPGGKGYAASRASAAFAGSQVDVLSTVVRSIGSGEPATIVDVAQRTGLPLDTLARTLQSGVDTGLLNPVGGQDSRAYALTSLGRKVL
jgi:hypothetical protein